MNTSLNKKKESIESYETLRSLYQDFRNENSFFREILSSIPHPIISLDLEGFFLYYNHRAENIFHLSIKNKKQKIFEHPNFKKLQMEIELIYIQQEKVEWLPVQLEDKNKYHLSSFPYVKEGKIEGYTLIFQNLSDRDIDTKKAWKDKTIASLAILTAGIAHEIKNPLGALDLHMQLAHRFVKNKNINDKKELMEYLNIIQHEISRLDNILNNFLTTLRPVKGQKKENNMKKLLKEVYQFIKPELNGKEISYHENLPKQNIKFPFDYHLMYQVLINLIKNSIQALEGIFSPEIIISLYYFEKEVQIKVEDNGKGISEAEISKIFDPFYTSKINGSGVGLTLVYKIIDAHGGNIEVNSQENKGTLFTIYLPLPSTTYLP